MDPAFLTRVGQYKAEGWRLSVVNATAVLPGDELPDGAFDITWSFALGSKFETLRERVLPGEEVPSISSLYGGAFLYENEMRELFGINMAGIAVDLRGELYKTATRVPFSPSAIRARLEATGRGAAPTHKAGPASAVAAARPSPAPTAAPASRPIATPAARPADAAAGRRGEDKADPSTGASGLQTSVSEESQGPTQSSPASRPIAAAGAAAAAPGNVAPAGEPDKSRTAPETAAPEVEA